MRSCPDTTKCPVNLSTNARTLAMAKELGINFSQAVDTFLATQVQRRYWERWNENNKVAVGAYNERLASEGLPFAKYRRF